MGSSKSKVTPVLSEESSSCPAESNGTSCWTGIRKFFSRNSKVVPLASVSDADIDNDEDSDDDEDLVHTSTTAQVATEVDFAVASAAVAEPAAELHCPTPKGVLSDLIGQKDQPIISQGVKSSPVISQKCEQPSMPAERRSRARVRSERPSTSYPADVRVSSASFLHYHRFVNALSEDESCDVESSTEDEYVSDGDIDSDVDEIAGRCIARKFSKRAIKSKRSVRRRKGPKGVKGSKKPGDESSDNETRPVTSRPRSRRVEKVRSTVDDVTKKTDEGTINNLSGDDVTNANEIKSRDEGGDVNEMEFFLFMISLSWCMHVFVAFTFPDIFAVIVERVENETDDDETDDDDDDEEEGKKEKNEKEEKLKKGKRKKKTKHIEEEEDPEEEEEEEEDKYEPDWVSESETDINQPSTSYKRNKRATYDFIIQKRFVEVYSDEYIW